MREVALIAGGVRNSDLAIAQRFAAEGWDVCITSRKAADAQAAAKLMKQQGGGAIVLIGSVHYKGDARAIGQMVSLLMDSALKYAPEGDKIRLDMYAGGRSINLSVRNSTRETIDRECLSHVFDRFYRADASRNSETGGHGIGLSVVKAIVSAHGGKVQAVCPEDRVFQINITLPV